MIPIQFHKITLFFCCVFFNALMATGDVPLIELASATEESASLKVVWELIEGADRCIKDSPLEALVAYEKALGLSQKEGSSKAESHALNGMGRAHYILGNYHQAMDAFEGALKIREQLNDTEGIANGYNNIALIYAVQDQVEQAIRFHEKSLAYCEGLDKPQVTFNNYFNMSIDFDELTEYAEALRCVDLALEIAESNEIWESFTMASNRKAEILCHLGKVDASIQLFQSLLEGELSLTLWERCFSLSGLSKALIKKERWDEGLKNALEAHALAKEIGSKWEVKRALECIVDAHVGLGNFEDAYDSHVKLKAISDQFAKESAESEYNYLMLQREQYENQRLEGENRVNEHLLSVQNQKLQISAIAFFTIVVLLIVVYRKHRVQIQLNRLLSERTDVLEQQSKELKDANVELQRLHDAKNQIYSIIAHDLRGPIGNLQLLTDISVEQFANREMGNIEDTLLTMRKQSEVIFYSLENLLFWANSHRGRISFHAESQSIINAIDPAIELLESNAAQKRIKIVQRISPTVVANYDVMLVGTVIRNLLNNAIKYTKEGGQIEIDANVGDTEIIVSVADDGLGMAPELQERIFSPDHYETTFGTNSEKGSGLGLKISAEFITLHQGRIWVESEVGKGSVFYFSLPIA